MKKNIENAIPVSISRNTQNYFLTRFACKKRILSRFPEIYQKKVFFSSKMLSDAAFALCNFQF